MPSDNPAVFKPLLVNLSFCKMFPLKSDLTGCQRRVRKRRDTGFLIQRSTLSSPKPTANPSKRKGWWCCLKSARASGDPRVLKRQDPARASHPESPDLFSFPSTFRITSGVIPIKMGWFLLRKGTGDLEVKQSGESGFPVWGC